MFICFAIGASVVEEEEVREAVEEERDREEGASCPRIVESAARTSGTAVWGVEGTWSRVGRRKTVCNR